MPPKSRPLPCEPPRFSRDDAVAMAREHFGLEAEVRELVSYADQNFRLRGADGRDWVLKVAHSGEERGVLDFQHRVMERLAASGLAVPRPRRALHGGEIVEVGGDGVRHLARVLSFLPGTFLVDEPRHTPQLLRSLGAFLGRLDRALAGFSHPSMHRDVVWDLRKALAVRERAADIEERDGRERVEALFDAYAERVVPRLGELPSSVVHNDANDYNVLVGDGDGGGREVVGLIDFGDMVATVTVSELATAAAYAMLDKDDPLAAAAAVAAGYDSAYPLAGAELEVLYDLVLTRLATSVASSAHLRKLHPENDYLAVSERPVWALLRQLRDVDPGLAYETFRKACSMSPTPSVSPSSAAGLPPAEILARRKRYLGGSLGASYRKPLKIVRGAGQFLYDENGRAYLDTVNNVCHVGHCHPKVVRAAQEQIATLNTNSRYLHDHLVSYAERLTATLPDPLSVCFFVSSGSEANELALRMARTHTGGEDVVVVDGAYHGNTSALVDLSPYKLDGPGGRGAPPWVHKVPSPDVYRGPYKADDAQAGKKYAAHVAETARAAADGERGFAAFFCESMVSCGGQFPLPEGYLKAAYPAVREAGGVCVADEVQVGFGRAGSRFWAFELQDVVPDIVTMGKPIGNGHPLAAVVTTPEIAESFDNGMEYFNTYGGNPVSCAVGLAVLDVIEEEGLQANALKVGTHLKEKLAGLLERHPLIGDVRGEGLFIGIELVRDRTTLEPAKEEAKEIVERMKEEGILQSVDGPLENVLKIKPPIVFTEDDADRLVATLGRVMGELGY